MPINKNTVSPSQTPFLNIDAIYYKNHSDVTGANFTAKNSRPQTTASSDSITCPKDKLLLQIPIRTKI